MSSPPPEHNPYAAPAGDGRDVLEARAFAELHQRTLGPMEMLGLALRVFAARPVLIILLVVIVGLPANILSVLQEPVEIDSFEGILQSTRETMWIEAIFGVASSIGLAKITEVVARAESVSSGEILRHLLRRLLSGIGTRVMYSIGCGLLTCLLVIPGIAFLIYWGFSDSVVSLRGIGGTRALEYSKRLVIGRWWTIFVTTLAMAIPMGVVMILVGLASGYVIDLLGGNPALSVVSDSMMDVLAAVLSIAFTIYFLNLDYLAGRKEEPIGAS